MLFLIEIASAAASVVALTMTVVLLERWFRARQGGAGGLAEAAALALVVWTVVSFSWLFIEVQAFIADAIVVFPITCALFLGIVIVTYLPWRERARSITAE
jgi:hypothetical protein